MIKYKNQSVLILFLSLLQFSVFANSSVVQDKIDLWPKKITVKAGSLVILETTTNLQSGTASIGTIIPFRVMTNVIVNGHTVIASGTRATGRIKNIIPSTYNDPAIIQIEVKYVQAVDGQQVNLSTNPIDMQAVFPNQGVSINVGTEVTSHIMNDIVIRVQ